MRHRHLLSPLLSVGIAALIIGVISPRINAASAAPAATGLTLVAQTNWVTQNSGFNVTLAATGTAAATDLGLRVALYPRLSSRYALENNPLEGSPSEIYPSLNFRGGTLHFRVIGIAGSESGLPSARTLRLDCVANTCTGVYPIAFSLIDRSSRRVVASLTTSLIYLDTTHAATPLRVAITLPMDLTPSEVTQAQPLSRGRAAGINSVVHTIATAGVPLSLNLYGRLLQRLMLDANAGSSDATVAHATIVALRRLTLHHQEIQLLASTFAPLDLNAMDRAPKVQRTTYAAQLATTQALDTSELHLSSPSSSAAMPSVLSSSAVAMLGQSGLCNLALPESAVSLSESGQTVDAPFRLLNTNCNGLPIHSVAIVSGLSNEMNSSPQNPVLAAHQLVADLSQTYFENPNAPQPRGVAVMPATWQNSPLFISTLVSALHANPVLLPVTLASLFTQVPDGANGEATAGTVTGSTTSAPITRLMLSTAYGSLNRVREVLPNDSAVTQGLRADIFNAESIGLTASARHWLLTRSDAVLAGLAHTLGLSGPSHVTLTASSGKIPITIHYTGGSYPLNLLLRIKSSILDFPATEVSQHLALDHADTNEVLHVSSRTSGETTLTIELLTPSGGRVLLAPTTFTVTSTAASGVAIGLSIGALLVLALWWSRSILRHRREKLAKVAAHPHDGNSAGEPGPHLR